MTTSNAIENYVCAAWGGLFERTEHMDCPVVITSNSVCVPQLANEPVPRVCKCECTTCKRAWWDQGRPKIVEGKMIYRED